MVGESAEVARQRSAEVGEKHGTAIAPRERQRWPELALEEQPGLREDKGDEGAAVRRGPSRRPKPLPPDVLEELAVRVDSQVAARARGRLADAVGAYERDRYRDAQRILGPLIALAPDAPSLRELMGLCLYRQGRWGEAIRHLEAFVRLTGSFDQHPVLADCHRALGHGAAVRECWDELRLASPSAELVAEGRIVMAAALADEGELDQAIGMLDAALRPRKTTREHHLRQWYALGDLHERAGDLARARDLFARVAEHDPNLSDVAERLEALGGRPPGGRPPGGRPPGGGRLSRSPR